MNRMKLNLLQRIGLEVLWGLSKLFAIMPYRFKYYAVEPVLFFLLYYCVRYRRGVVKANLRNSFPEKSEEELLRIRRRFYHTLAEIFIDTINMAHMPPEKARRALEVGGLEKHVAEVHGRDWIALSAHFGCWEYCSYWGVYEPSQMLVAVYHPLHNVVVGALFQRLRNHANSMAVPMNDSLRFYLRNREKGIEGKNLVMGLIADQSPLPRPDMHWLKFLNQDAFFFDGGEKLALRCRLPVYFVRMERLQRGRYRMSFELLYDGREKVAPHEITERYVRRLERMIRERPELWMWSHRRWKRVPPYGSCR